MALPQNQLTFGTSGSGKTYVRCPVFLLTQFLPEFDDTIHWSNFPLGIVPEREGGDGKETYIDRICVEAAKLMPKKTPADFAKRVRMIPFDEMMKWKIDIKKGGSGPWEYFKDENCKGIHLAIDELHNYCGADFSLKHQAEWGKFVGEWRHRGGTFEGLSQHPEKLPKALKNEIQMHRYMIPCELRRDPFLRAPLSDWYELRAKFITGKYLACTFEQTTIMLGAHKEVRETIHWLFPQYFRLYDSYNAPIKGGRTIDKPVLRAYQQLSGPQLLLWFARRNAWGLVTFSWIPLVILFVMFGGVGWLIGTGTKAVSGVFVKSMQQSFMKAGKHVDSPVIKTDKVPPIPPQETIATISGVKKNVDLRTNEDDPDIVVLRPVAISADYCIFEDGQRVRLGNYCYSGSIRAKVESLDPVEGTIVLAGRLVDVGRAIAWRVLDEEIDLSRCVGVKPPGARSKLAPDSVGRSEPKTDNDKRGVVPSVGPSTLAQPRGLGESGSIGKGNAANSHAPVKVDQSR